MAETTDVFDFRGWGLTKAKPGEMRGRPVVVLCLKSWTTWKPGTPTLTPQLMSEREIDAYIRLLQKDLVAAGERAKAALRKAQSRS
jgi:hypothetical protein